MKKLNYTTMKLLKLIPLSILCFSISFCSDDNKRDTEPKDPVNEMPKEDTDPIEEPKDEEKPDVVDENKKPVTFSKENNADVSLEANQDRITDKVWITRGRQGEIYNIVTENAANGTSSPKGTKWAIGKKEDIPNLNFVTFKEALNNRLKEIVGKKLIMHLEEENLYYEVEFSSWTSSKDGGGFSYTRTLIEIDQP